VTKRPFQQADKRGYHHGRLKDALLDAARALLAERGPAGFTLAEAAKLVGVTAAAPYRHFADRDAVVGELAARGFERFAHHLATAWDEGRPDPFVALGRMGIAYLAFSREEPGLYAAMFNAVGATSKAGATSERAFAVLRSAAREILRRRGALDGGAQELALQIWSLSHGVATLAMAGRLNEAVKGWEPDRILNGGVAALIEMAAYRGRAP
jgi:AcrR family transcriptional regulator